MAARNTKTAVKPKKKRGPRMKDPMVAYLPKLERWLILGYLLPKACVLSGLPYTTVYDYYNRSAKFRIAIETLINGPAAKARANIVTRINQGSVEDSWKWLERKDRDEFATRTENTGKDGEPLTTPMEVVFVGPEKK